MSSALGWVDQVEDVLRDVKFSNWYFHVGVMGDGAYVQCRFLFLHATVPPQHGRKWYVSPHSTKSEIVQTAFKAVLTVQEHETREQFFYKGMAVFGPHFDVDVLARCATEKKDVRDVSPLKGRS